MNLKNYFFLAITFFIIPHASLSQNSGVTSRKCPYNCDLAGLSRDSCREWRVGDRCYVEDRSFEYSDGVIVKPSKEYTQNRDRYNLEENWDSSSSETRDPFGGDSTKSKISTECRDINRYDLTPPSINISRVRDSETVFGYQVKIKGSIEGVCLTEAGLFENGEKTKNISVASSRNFKRFDFEVLANKNSKAEIRAYNTAGEKDVYVIDNGDQTDPFSQEKDTRTGGIEW